MPNINFELNLNKHPKDVPNRALISATNVQLSKDLSCLQSEFCIKENNALKSILIDKYIAGYIPCNKEFILFVAPKDWKSLLENYTNGITIDVWRFREQGKLDNNHHGSFDLSEGKKIYNKFIWHGGEIKGTFTYNIKSQLILAIAEYDTKTEDNIPLKTINVGEWDDVEYDTQTNTITILADDTDLNLNDDLISLNPKIKIPELVDFHYVNGLAYKGWYYIYLRYKINSIDYTKWYNIGYPIFIDELEKFALFNYFIKSNLMYGNNVTFPQGLAGEGIVDYISSGSNTCNKTISLELNHYENEENGFKQYQIGIVCCTKDEQRAFKSLDIDITKTEFILNFNSLEEYNINDLVFEKYNYYNVKNIINYKNRLYLSNYKENNIRIDELDDLKHKVSFSISRKEFEYKKTNEGDTNKYVFDWLFANESSGENPRILQNNENELRFNINKNFSDLIVDEYNPVYITLEGGVYNNEPYPFYTDINNITEIPFDYFKNITSNIITGTKTVYINDLQFLIEFIGTLNITNSTDIGDGYDTSGNISGTFKIQTTRYDYSSSPKDNYNVRLKNTTLLPGETYNFYIHFVNKYGEYSEGIRMTFIGNAYGTLNSDGSVTICGGVANKYVNANSKVYIYNIDLEIDDTIVSNDYIGFFITYEKFQKIKQFCGILTRYDFPYIIEQGIRGYKDFDDGIYHVPLNPYDKFIYYMDKSDKPDQENKYKFRFYCTDIDTQDVIELNFDKLIIEANDFNKIETKLYGEGDDISYANNGNIEATGVLSANQKEYKILSAEYVAAHNFSKNNDYRGSYIELELEDGDELVKNLISSDKYFYKAILLSNKNNLYLSDNKSLMKFTNTYYFDEIEYNEHDVGTINISNGLPGFCTFNTALIYNNNKVILNTGYNVIVDRNYYSYIMSTLFSIGEEADNKMISMFRVPFVGYYTYIDFNNYPFESRKFKTLPEIISIRTEGISDTVPQAIFAFTNATIVQPMNSIDLFENKIGSQDNVAIKTYINFIKESVNIFDKRIIRSNPIADESFENSWRTFSPEAYKDITENKGNITNLVALGTTFLVHTEHSLFMFDRDNTLQNGDGNTMQLAMPDVFDIDYKEVLASELGSCGLQDSKAWIVDEFGYVFYDNDAHTFYRFGSKKIENINSSITQFIDKYKPYRVRFANDSESNRLLVNLLYVYDTNNIEEKTLSFNYIINRWISFHDYCFDRAFNTKQMVYLIVDRIDSEEDNYSNLYLINRQTNDIQNKEVIKNLLYSQFDNIRDLTTKKDWYYSDIAIMINDGYELIKTLEYISWKLYKIKSLDINDTNYKDFPREELRTPYSGYELRIYNDNVDSGIIDITVNSTIDKNKSVMNYKKPWWQYDNWNLNSFRDIKNAKSQLAKYMSRLYGNYFIIRIWFGDSSQKCEFETLNCKVITNQTI